ncbi:MAG: nitroreductase [Betaproteobacteria bacterium]|nr:nitroreductase [Betaproteobacteria bacterium]
MTTTLLTDPDSAHLLASLANRHSVGPKYLTYPAPDLAQLEAAARVASRATDHGMLGPFRFVLVGEAQRPRLAELFAADAAQRGRDAEAVERARERAFNGPALLAMVVRVRADVPDVPPNEQWLSAGAGLMNLLNALHLMGFAAKVLSGPLVRNPRIAAAFCETDESLSACIIAGTQLHTPAPHGHPNPPPLVSCWD